MWITRVFSVHHHISSELLRLDCAMPSDRRLMPKFKGCSTFFCTSCNVELCQEEAEPALFTNVEMIRTHLFLLSLRCPIKSNLTRKRRRCCYCYVESVFRPDILTREVDDIERCVSQPTSSLQHGPITTHQRCVTCITTP